MCHSDADIISSFNKAIQIGKSSISATCTKTNKSLVLEFKSRGSSVCVGSEIANERHFFLPYRYYDQVLAALSQNLTIGIKGKEGPQYEFTRVSWRTV